MPASPEFLTWAALAIFVGGFASFLAFDKYRHWLALAAAGLVVALGLEGPREAFLNVNWIIIAIFFATLVAAEIFMLSGAAAVAAEAILVRLKRPTHAILALCALTGFLSMFVENVACVLIAAPVALSLARRLKMPAAPVLISCALASNLQGAALLVGDPPSMLLAQYAHFTFADFIWFDGRPSIFFSIQAGGVVGLAVLWLSFRRYRGEAVIDRTARMIGVVPTVCLAGVVIALAVDTQIEGGIGVGAVIGTGFFALVSILWYANYMRLRCGADETPEDAMLEHRLPTMRRFILGLDWRTTLFLVAIFVPVSALEKYGWIDRLGEAILALSQGNRIAAFSILVGTAVAASAVVDNVPFLLVMLPAIMPLAAGMGITWQPVFLYFGLLIGASVGGNITPVGAQANITAIGFLRRQGSPTSLWDYMKLSVPYTIAAVAASCLVTYLAFGIVPPSR